MEAVLDYGLSGIAAAGAGLLVYAFTGGEEEYPSAQPMPESITQFNNMGFQDEDALEERDSILEERLELAFNGFEDHLKGLTRINETILTKVETLGKVQPVWATELLEKVRQLTVDVAEMKQNQRQILLHHARSDTAESSEDNEQRFIDQVDLAVACLENGVPFDMPIADTLTKKQLNAAYFIKNHGKISLASDMLSMFIKNVLKNPDSPRFRKISTSNANYKTMLGNLLGYQRILTAVGFVLKGTAWEWEWADDGNHGTIDTRTPGVRSGDDKPKPELASKIMQYMLDKLQMLRSQEHRASVAAALATAAEAEEIKTAEKAPASESEPGPLIIPSFGATSQATVDRISKEEQNVETPIAASKSSILEESLLKSTPLNENIVDIIEDVNDLTILSTASSFSAEKPLGTPYNQRGYSFSRGGLLGSANLPIGLRFDDIVKKVDSSAKK